MQNTATTTISFLLSKDVKQQAEEVFQGLGLNMSIALNMFLAQAIRYRGIPFDVRLPNEETMEALEELREMRKHPENYKTYEDVDAMMEDILADEI